MSEPVFLSVEQVLKLHQKGIALYGGSAGLGDRPLLESAVHQPVNAYQYAKADLFEMAAAYAFHLAKNHAFEDGNKRVGLFAALEFLELNGVAMPSSAKPDLVQAMLDVAAGKIDKTTVAALFRKLAA